MGAADYFADGQWNFYCDLCGRTEKSSRGVKTWDNLYVCRRHEERRNPQDFVRGVKDVQSVPWVRDAALGASQAPVCTIVTASAIPGLGVAGCLIPGNNNPAALSLYLNEAGAREAAYGL